jgi:hypothetical protein
MKLLCVLIYFSATIQATSLSDLATRYIGTTGYWCSEFVTKIVEEFDKSLLEGIPTVTLFDDEKTYVSTLGFMWAGEHSIRWKDCGRHIDDLKPNRLLTYTKIGVDINPTDILARENHAMIIKNYVKSEIRDGLILHYVDVIDSSARLDDGTPIAEHHVTLNSRRVFISNEDGFLTGFLWKCGKGTINLKNIMIIEPNFSETEKATDDGTP